MSIYSGFGTRQQETLYNTLIESTIKLLQSKVVANLHNELPNDPLFKMQLLKNYDLLLKLEAHKYLLPKFSESIKKLVMFIIKDQITTPKEKEIKIEAKEFESLPKSDGSNGSKGIESLQKSATTYRLSERSATPTLPLVRSSMKIRNFTPVKGQKADSGFLYARLTNN